MSEEVEKLTKKEFYSLVKRVKTAAPQKADIEAYKKTLPAYPEFWRFAGDLVQQNFSMILEDPSIAPVIREALKLCIEDQRREMGHETASPMEKALIDHVVLCKLRLDLCENKYTAMDQHGSSLPKAEFWEKRLSSIQRRYLRACETLERVRRLTRRDPALQVNIATQGGQQVNIAGDLVQKD